MREFHRLWRARLLWQIISCLVLAAFSLAFTALSARKVGSPWRYAFAPSLLVGIMVAVQIIGDYGDLGMGAAYEAAAARAPSLTFRWPMGRSPTGCWRTRRAGCAMSPGCR